ncbi:MAG TPA: GAF domain-containing protein, partial [Candidatus Limnocylindrales bacterium]
MVIHADRPSPSAREDEALLRGISDLGEGLVVVQGGHVLDANEAFCRIAGRSHAELTALGSLVEIVEPAARPELADLLRRSEAGVGAEDRFRGRLRRPDGSDVHVDVAVKSIDESGEDRRLVVLVRDATAQLRLETELRAQKLVLEAQTEASLDGILVISAEGEVAFANRRFAELWRIPEETIASASEAAVQAAIRERLADPDPFFARVSHLETHPAEDDRGELRLLDGRTFDRYTAPISDEAGRLHGRVWFFRDVTREHRRAAGSALLADASKLLAGSLEYETIATRIAEFIVPRLADWCAVDVVGDDGLFHRIGAAHADAARVRILEELDRRFPIRANEGHLRGRVVATGEPIAMFDVDELQLRSISRNEEHHELLAELGIRSAIWVPLAARGRVLGVMSFGLMSESRRFGETELALGEELGRRAALSLDNALVYRRLRDREQQQAVVAALGQAALTMSQLEELLDEAARRVAATLGVEFSKILELLPDRAGLRLVAGVGWRPGLVGSTILGVDRRSQAGYTLMSRSAVIVEDIAAETRFAEPSLLA